MVEGPDAASPLADPAAGAPLPPPTSPGSTGELFGNKPATLLTLNDAFETGFRIVTKWSFIFPVMVVSVLVNAVVEAVAPRLLPSLANLQGLSPAEVERLITGGLALFGITLVGSFLASVYAWVWAVAATSGPLPTTEGVLRTAARRLPGILGTGAVVVLFSITILIPTAAAVAIGATVNAGLAILLGIAIGVIWVWLWGRISMAIWLAAEGHPVGASLRDSWRMTKGRLLLVLGWSFLYGIVAGLITGLLGAVLGLLPYTGGGVAQAISIGITTGAGVTLFRRVQAAAAASGEARPTASAPTGQVAG